jgi:HSP20 family protein
MRAREAFMPSVDFAEHDNECIMKVDLPGMREQDIDVRIDDNNVLTISGERRAEEKKKVRGYEYSERSYGKFSRSVSLPTGVDASKIEADFRNGVLEIHVQKTAEAVRARKIPVREEPRVLPGNGGAEAQQPQAQQAQTRGS